MPRMEPREVELWAGEMARNAEVMTLFDETDGVGRTLETIRKSETLVELMQSKLPAPFNCDSRAAIQVLLRMANMRLAKEI